MRKNNKDQLVKVEVREGEQKEEEKKTKRQEAASKRRSSKKKDKAARWSGMILFVVLLFVGFLMWVAGEVKEERGGERLVPPSGNGVSPQSQPGRIVVE